MADERGPELLREVLSRLMVARGWGRRQGRMHLENAWAEAVNPEHAKCTRLLGLRRGILEVEVANSAALQELAHFYKRSLLKKLQQKLPSMPIKDLRFRAGSWKTHG